MRRILLVVLISAALVALVWFTAGPPKATPNPPGSFSFGVFGDAPYYAWEEIQYPIILRSINEHDLISVIHVGDIFWRDCSDDHYRQALGRFNSLRHPVIYTPGDNEWRDCWRKEAGRFDPEERLQSLRRIFFADPDRSLGHKRIPLAHQQTFIENARWAQNGIVFATIHVVSPGKSTREQFEGRLNAAAEWTREAFATAASRNAIAVVIAFQADVDIEKPPSDEHRRRFEALLNTIEEEAAKFRKPVLVAHGDGHTYTVDHPISARNVTRLEVPGSPLVGWVRVIVTPASQELFRFEQYVVPDWKYW